MRIVYNPKDGAPITQWVFKGFQKEPHYPDGFEVKGKIQNGLKQYTDQEAESILETYEFLNAVSVDEARKIIERPEDPKYKCEYPDCGFASSAKIGLEGHKRKHKLQGEDAKPVLDPELIPVSGGQRIMTPTEIQRKNDPLRDLEIGNGTDSDGVDWYGDGVRVENQSADSFGGIRQPGKGHFVG